MMSRARKGGAAVVIEATSDKSEGERPGRGYPPPRKKGPADSKVLFSLPSAPGIEKALESASPYFFFLCLLYTPVLQPTPEGSVELIEQFSNHADHTP